MVEPMALAALPPRVMGLSKLTGQLDPASLGANEVQVLLPAVRGLSTREGRCYSMWSTIPPRHAL